jgi:hypothetical protein
VICVKRRYNTAMAITRHGRTYFEAGEFARYNEATPGDDLDPVVRIMEDLGTVEVPCGKLDCRSNCLEYAVASRRGDFTLAECKLSALVNIL